MNFLGGSQNDDNKTSDLNQDLKKDDEVEFKTATIEALHLENDWKIEEDTNNFCIKYDESERLTIKQDGEVLVQGVLTMEPYGNKYSFPLNSQNASDGDVLKYNASSGNLEFKTGSDPDSISGSIDALEQKVDDEIFNRQIANDDLESKITLENQERVQADDAINLSIDDLQSQLDQEIKDRAYEDSQINSALTLESSIRANTDLDLINQLNQEKLDRETGDTNLDDKINQEKKDREAGDLKHDDEISQLNAGLNLEATNRANGDAGLSDEIDVERKRIDNIVLDNHNKWYEIFGGNAKSTGVTPLVYNGTVSSSCAGKITAHRNFCYAPETCYIKSVIARRVNMASSVEFFIDVEQSKYSNNFTENKVAFLSASDANQYKKVFPLPIEVKDECRIRIRVVSSDNPPNSSLVKITFSTDDSATPTARPYVINTGDMDEEPIVEEQLENVVADLTGKSFPIEEPHITYTEGSNGNTTGYSGKYYEKTGFLYNVNALSENSQQLYYYNEDLQAGFFYHIMVANWVFLKGISDTAGASPSAEVLEVAWGSNPLQIANSGTSFSGTIEY